MNFSRNLFAIAISILSAGLIASDFTLIQDNQPQCAILLPPGTHKSVTAAIGNFNKTLKTITGTGLPVVSHDVPGNRITLAVQKPDSLLTIDHFTISFPDARTLRIEGSATSIQWAFNHLIREYTGAEWILIESCGLSYTPMKDLVIPANKIEYKQASWPVYRSYTHVAAWWMLNYQNQFRVGHDLTYHAFPVKKYGKDNSWPKEIMPVLNGKKITAPPSPELPESYWQPCYSNPETARIAVENLLEYLKNKPDTLNISLGCNDNAGYCECAECLKMDKNRRYNRSESYFTFINRVMAVIGKKYPKLLVSAFAYERTYLPPSFKIHPNVLVSLCIDFNSCVEPRMLAKHKQAISEWSRKASMLGVWDYSWGSQYPAPRLYAPYHLDMLKYLYEHNGRGYYANCDLSNAAEGPKQYLVAKFLWDSTQDMKKVEDDWYIRCVGKKAAPYLKAYFKVWNDYFTGRAKLTPWFQTVFNTYMNFGELSCVYGLRESDYQAAADAMKKVVELAETTQEKERAELMARHCRYTLLRLRMLGAGVYNPDGSIKTPAQALKLLDIVVKYPEYQEQYQQISEIFKQDPDARATYLNPYYLREGASPVGRKFDLPMSSHISASAPFAKHPGVAAKMLKIAEDSRQNDSIRRLCKALANPSKQKNLLPGGNAENGIPEMFEIHPELRSYGELSISEKYRSEGKKSFKISVKGYDTLLWIQVPAKPLTAYLATFKAFTPKSSAEGYMETNLYAEKNGRNQQYRQPPAQKVSGRIWESFAIQTVTKKNSDSIRLRIHLRKFEKGDEIYIDDIRIMELGPASSGKKSEAKKSVAPVAKTVFTLNQPADFLRSQAVSQENGVLQIKGGGEFTSAKTLILDPAKKYRLSGQFRRKSGSPVQVLFGYIPLDAKGKTIYPWYILTRDGTGTVVAEEAKRGEKVLRVKDASQWKADTSHGFVAFDVKDDYSDLPNRSVVPMLKNGIEKEGDSWKIALRSALPKNIPTGTKVRQHSNGATYIWNGGVAKLNDKWTTKSGILSGQVKHGNAQNKLWPGTKSVRVLIRLNGKADSVTEIRNVKVEEIQ